MFNRPRCRDWTPLATQQLRLRNLIKITGHNILPSNHSNNTKLYYSLHYNKNDEAFYVSETLNSHGNGNFNWSDINCFIMLKSMSKFICIKVWEHCPIPNNNKQHQNNSIQTIDKEITKTITTSVSQNDSMNMKNEENQNDKLLFMWGVYFSGLIFLAKFNDIQFLKNSLSFQMHGGNFVSAESLTPGTMRQQLSLNYELDNAENVCAYNNSVSGDETKNCDINKTTNFNSNKIIKSQIHSEIDSVSDNSQHIPRKFQINSPRASRSCSPDNLITFSEEESELNAKVITKDITSSVTNTENIWSTKTNSQQQILFNLLNMLKIRYAEKTFNKSEIRESYKLDKLLQLQERQRRIMKNNEDIKELNHKITMISPFCLNLELLKNNKFHNYHRPNNFPSMGRTLNRLLFQQIHVEPEDIIKSHKLKCQTETVKFRLKLIMEERNQIEENCRKLEKKLSLLQDNNIELESWLMSRYRNLSREKELLVNEKIELLERREYHQKIQKALRHIRAQLCYEIKEIYPIERKYADKYVIGYIHLPHSHELSSSASVNECLFNVTPLSLSSALGYVAHVLKMCSIILNLPLRNPIKHEGSRSRIIDIVKAPPNTSREFPLYSRSFPPPKPVLYAVYLLNQNIAQLNAQIYGIRHCDLKATLANLLQLLNGTSSNGLGTEYQSLERLDLHDFKNLPDEQSISSSMLDLNILPVPSITTLNSTSNPIDVVDKKSDDQRISRSVGSYSYENISTANKDFYNSEPILATANQKVQITSFSDNGNI